MGAAAQPESLAFYQATATVIPVLFLGLIANRYLGVSIGATRRVLWEVLNELIAILFMVAGETSAFIALARGRGSDTLQGYCAAGLIASGLLVVGSAFLWLVVKPAVEHHRAAKGR